MKRIGFVALVVLVLSGCAAQTVSVSEADDCCKPEIVYVDKAVAECTREIQRITQVSTCAKCDKFPVTARVGSGCAK